MTKKQSIVQNKRVPADSIKEVQELLDLQQEIDEFRSEHAAVFRHYDDLVARYNAALDIAEKVVRLRGVSCGPFVNFSNQVNYNPEKMYDELGEELFLQVGGKMTTRTVYEVEKERVEKAIAADEIPTECVDHFRSITRKYRKPDRL